MGKAGERPPTVQGWQVDCGLSLWEVGDLGLDATPGCAGQGRALLRVFVPRLSADPTTTRTGRW